MTVGAGSPTCVWPNCQPGIPELRVVDLPIFDRVSGTPTAIRAKMAEVAYGSGARDLRAIRRKRERLILVGMELAVVL